MRACSPEAAARNKGMLTPSSRIMTCSVMRGAHALARPRGYVRNHGAGLTMWVFRVAQIAPKIAAKLVAPLGAEKAAA